jgi:hypothetical protein
MRRVSAGAGALLAQRGPSLGPRGPVEGTTSPAGGWMRSWTCRQTVSIADVTCPRRPPRAPRDGRGQKGTKDEGRRAEGWDGSKSQLSVRLLRSD